MLQIRLNKGTTSSIDGVPGLKSTVNETVNVACPDHLVLADLPVAKGLGSATSASIVKIVGRRSRRQLAERVHFCVRCDFPIAIYGRLSPCDHAFCLDCARSDSICYLCDERIQKIQTIKMMEGIFICAAPHCLKSFLKKSDFESHIHENHADLLHPNMKKEEISEQEGSGTKQSSTLDTTLRGPPRPGFPSSANHPLNDREDKARRQQPRDQPPPRPFMPPKPPQFYGQVHPSDAQADNRPAGLDGPGQNQMQQHNVDNQGGPHQEFGQFSEKQPGIMPDPHREYPPMYTQQPPNFPMPLNANPMMMGPPPFGFPPFPSDGAPPFYGAPAPYEVARSDSTGDGGSEQGAVNMGFAPGPGGPVNYPEAYPRPWNVGPTNIPFEAVQGAQGLMAAPQQGMPPPPPPPGPPPPHIMQHKHDYFSGDINSDERSYGWQSERRDGFGNSQD